MEDIRTSKLLKAICYIIIPILTLIIIVNTISIGILVENKEKIENNEVYFETENFRDRYLSTIYSMCKYLNRGLRISTETEQAEQTYLEEVEDKSLQRAEEINYSKISDYMGETFEVLIIKNDGIYTNVDKTTRTDEVEEIKQYIMQKQYHWSYVDDKIETDIEKMKYEEIAYDGYFVNIQETGCEIYSCVKNLKAGQFETERIVFEIVAKTYKSAPVTILVSSILLISAVVYLAISTGHKKGQKETYTDSLDKIPLEIIVVILGGMLTIEILLMAGGASVVNWEFWTGISLIVLMGLIIYATAAVGVVTCIRRIKAKVLLKNTLCYKFCKYLNKKINNFKELLLNNISTNAKIILTILSIVAFSIILFILSIENFFFMIVLLIFLIIVIKIFITEMNKLYKLREKIKQLYKGKVKETLDITQFTGEMQQVAVELNDISGGLSHAIEDVLKSERLKTELITNVSHDIKTPLTSIINYVDLLKKENIQNETAREYLQILDNKSQRLKKLTEDLVEASKASSGNIKLNIEKLNLSELLKQVRGEFEDKFNEKGLEIVESLPQKDVYINADSKYLYRIMENLYTNISKYALENSRVYVDLVQSGAEENKKATIILKNISAEKLNISADELMQRFVRGDSARTTTGSGLGLSIAKSLTELQKGTFEMKLDGDLFKVIIEF